MPTATGMDSGLRAARIVVGGILIVAVSATTPATAAPTTHKPHHARPSSEPHDDVTGTIVPPKAAPPDHPPSASDDETLPELFHLPAASRARMHECGMTWQGMKMAGQTGDETWREFATVCLAAKDAPTSKTAR